MSPVRMRTSTRTPCLFKPAKRGARSRNNSSLRCCTEVLRVTPSPSALPSDVVLTLPASHKCCSPLRICCARRGLDAEQTFFVGEKSKPMASSALVRRLTAYTRLRAT
jgi:hypothetical protein